ncbi:MAG: tRNA pseudouridine(38-40) synthase TruA [Gemmatimonadetes bacterium]|nr:tRNA pseudouridine(38-40) synthase TruA [Gemmatimonadota bacterium]
MSESTSTARFRATVEYDGAGFHGSQLQPDVRTVQGEVESALSNLFDGPARIELSGRTDTGVHAVAQEIAFDAPPQWNEGELRRALGAVLPEDLALGRLSPAGGSFHPRFDATGRRYEYVVSTVERGRTFLRDRAWLLQDPLDAGALTELASGFVGERAFDAFAKSGQPERGTRCRIESAEWRTVQGRAGGPLTFRIVADRFLHHMVRYIVGTTIEVASGARPPSDLEALLANEPASRAVFPAPPHGLYLTGVRYAEGWNRAAGVPWLTESGDEDRGRTR